MNQEQCDNKILMQSTPRKRNSQTALLIVLPFHAQDSKIKTADSFMGLKVLTLEI